MDIGKVCPTFGGEYVENTEYKRYTFVRYNKSFYVSKKDTSSLPTTEDWQIVSTDAEVAVATLLEAGIVKPDGVTITLGNDGTISALQVTVDTELSTTSNNAIANSTVTTVLNSIQETLAGKSTVSFSKTQTSGTPIGTLTINGTDYVIYVPSRYEKVSASNVTAGTFASTATYMPVGEDYSTARMRNISAGESDLTAGTSTLTNGEIYLYYT